MSLLERFSAKRDSGSQNRGKAKILAKTETVLQCLFRLSVDYGDVVEPAVVRQRHLLQDMMPAEQIVTIASDFNTSLKAVHLTWETLTTTKFIGPVLLILNNSAVVLIKGVRQEPAELVAVSDPMFKNGTIFFLTREELEKAWSGDAFTSAPSPRGEEENDFSFSWVYSKMLTEKAVLRDIILAAVVMQAIALSLPLFFQIIVDRIIPNHAVSTLTTVGIGITALIIFDGAFNYVRNYFASHLTQKLDMAVAIETVAHLLSLPVSYFGEMPAGNILHKLSEAAHVRDFVAGRLLNTFLDMISVVLFLPLLFIYSWQLTLVILFVSSITFAVLALAARDFGLKLKEVTLTEGKRKTMLVEMISGITTIKTLALEPRVLRRWKWLSNDAAIRNLDLGRISASARATLGGLDKVMNVALSIVGVFLVFDDQITIGALIAFNMLGMRVSSPLIQSANLLQEYEKALLSLKYLGELMTAPSESGSGQLCAAIGGELEFDEVTFRYPKSATPALRGLSCRIEAGQTVGIVGRSGSGKTTLTRLMQGLYFPESGVFRFDGKDVKEFDLAHLRSQIGVVLQDTFLFRASIRENIAIARPDATLEEVIQVAHQSGAHEFIERLPQGYGTLLEEGAKNLSGGQRQRLAIARALLIRPKILIFDEATSALDPESEAIIRANLQTIAQGRTTIIVTHRLSFVRKADVILVIDDGVVSAKGTHEQLLRQEGIYQQLWRQQTMT